MEEARLSVSSPSLSVSSDESPSIASSESSKPSSLRSYKKEIPGKSKFNVCIVVLHTIIIL